MGYFITVNARDDKTNLDWWTTGTGCLECIVWHNGDGYIVSVSEWGVDASGLRLGSPVRIQGRVTEYRGGAGQVDSTAFKLCFQFQLAPLHHGGGGGGGGRRCHRRRRAATARPGRAVQVEPS